MTDMHLYKMVCNVSNASKDDLDRWLANHAKGRHSTLLQNDGVVAVYLDDDSDRIALRESFDVSKVTYTRD